MPRGVEWGLLKLNGALVQITTSSRRTDLIALPSTSSVPYAAAVSNRLTPSSVACRLIAIASASLLPRASPSCLHPPQPSPATPTRNPVLPSVVYSIIHLPLFPPRRGVNPAQRSPALLGIVERCKKTQCRRPAPCRASRRSHE